MIDVELKTIINKIIVDHLNCLTSFTQGRLVFVTEMALKFNSDSTGQARKQPGILTAWIPRFAGNILDLAGDFLLAHRGTLC